MRIFPQTAGGQAFKVATIFTLLAAVVLGGALTWVDISATNQVSSDGTDRLLKTVHALADGDLAGAKAGGLVTSDALLSPPAIPEPPSAFPGKRALVLAPGQGIPAKLFGIRMIAWRVRDDGTATPLTSLTPGLPPELTSVAGPAKASFAGQAFLVAGASGNYGRFVGAISVDALQTASRPFVSSALMSLPLVLGAIFVLSLLIGRASSAPIERNRRRQLEFAADASHELRTPLSVIRAETTLALSRPRTANQYRDTIERISGESQKLSDLVDNLLFLARADAETAAEDDAPRDLGAIVAATAERFAPVAASRAIDLAVEADSSYSRVVVAPDGWLERLAAVLIDNACRYTPEGGMVLVSVGGAPGQPTLTVADSGPGVPLGERRRIFDRFHRGEVTENGTGLGLAIAAAVIRRTHGRLDVLDSVDGGARFVASWRGVAGSA